MQSDVSSQRGNATPLILIAVVVIVAGIAGWMYFKKPSGDALSGDTAASPNLVPQQLEATEEIPATASTPDATAGPETTTGENASNPVKIDIVKAMGTRAIGDPAAPVKIIEYSSLTCSHCAHFHNDTLPELKQKYIDTGKVYMEFREFPLNDPALKATLTARCLPPEQYENFTGLLFKTQEIWAAGLDYMESLKKDAKLAGMSDETFEACHAEPQLKLAIAESMQKGKDKWNISATPTFIINDGAEVMSGAQPLEEFERIFRKVTNDAVGAAPAVE